MQCLDDICLDEIGVARGGLVFKDNLSEFGAAFHTLKNNRNITRPDDLQMSIGGQNADTRKLLLEQGQKSVPATYRARTFAQEFLRAKPE